MISALIPFAAAGLSLLIVFASLLSKKQSLSSWCFFAGMAVFGVDSVMHGLCLRAADAADAMHWLTLGLVVESLLPAAWLGFSLTYSRGDFRNATPDVEAEQLTVTLEDRGWLDTRYERSGRAQSRTVEEPQVSRTQIGSLPRGQMHMLMADTEGEPRYHHVLVPSPPMARVRAFKPTVYPPIPSSNWFSPNGANLRFADLKRPPRVSGRRG